MGVGERTIGILFREQYAYCLENNGSIVPIPLNWVQKVCQDWCSVPGAAYSPY